jgi:aspartokinase/homoserine dehydrogenase 1
MNPMRSARRKRNESLREIIESLIFKPCIVVVSAFGGIAEKIIATANIAMLHDPGYKDKMLEIRNRHFERVNDLLGNENREFTQIQH